MLSIVIPAYNEEKNIRATLEDIGRYLPKHSNYEVIVVDDGSTDNTEKEVLAVKDMPVRYFALAKNSGKGKAIQTGVNLARGDLILFMDADNATKIDNLLSLGNIRDNNVIAIGSRYMKKSRIVVKQPLLRRISGRINIALSNMILGMKLSDYNCGFKMFNRDTAIDLFYKLKSFDFSFDAEILYKAYRKGIYIKECPVEWTDKRETSKVRPLRDGIKTIKSLIRLKCGNI